MDRWCPNCVQAVHPRTERGPLGWLAWVLFPLWWLLASMLFGFAVGVLFGVDIGDYWWLWLVGAILGTWFAWWLSGIRRQDACPICHTRALEPLSTGAAEAETP